MSSNREDLLQAGYTFEGQDLCPKCKTLVDVFESPSGRKTILNTLDHPERPGWLHSLGCGKDSQKEFEILNPAEEATSNIGR